MRECGIAASVTAAVTIAAAAACGAPAAEPVAPEPHVAPPPPAAVRAACTMSGPWAYEQPHELRRRAGEPPFATVGTTTSATLRLGADGAHVELVTPALRITGVVPAADVILHPTRATVVADALVPGPQARLRWIAPSPYAQTVEVVLPADVRVSVPARTALTCDGLSLDATAAFEPRAAIDAPTRREAMVTAGAPVALSRAPGEPPVVELAYGSGDDPLVDVIDEQAGQARVVVQVTSLDPARDVLFVGWVDAARLHLHDRGFGGSWATGGATSLPDLGRLPGSPRLTCAHDVPFAIEQRGARELAGAIAQGATIVLVGPQEGDWEPVAVKHGQVELADGVRMLVHPAAVADCATATP